MSFEKDYLCLIDLMLPEKDFITYCMKKISDAITSNKLLNFECSVTITFEEYSTEFPLDQKSISKVSDLLESYWFNERDIGIYPILHIYGNKPSHLVIRIFLLTDSEGFFKRVETGRDEDFPIFKRNIDTMFNYCQNKILNYPGASMITPEPLGLENMVGYWYRFVYFEVKRRLLQVSGYKFHLNVKYKWELKRVA